VLYDAFDRRPPFDRIEFSSFDKALGRVPPPPGLTRDQFRRAVFEEMNDLPWSEGLEPPEGVSWLKRTPIEAASDMPVDPFRPDLYRFKRKTADRIIAAMNAERCFGPQAMVDPKGGLFLMDALRGDVTVISVLRARYRPAPAAHCHASIGYLDLAYCEISPAMVFLNPDLAILYSDEEAERVIRRMWRYAASVFEAVQRAVTSLPPGP